MFPVVVVIGFILWKYANGSDPLDPNLDCKIGCKVFAGGSSHCFASIRKLGNHRSSKRLRCFNPPKATNLAILVILAGAPSLGTLKQTQVLGLNVVSEKKCKASDKVVECIDCEKRLHAKCSDLSVDELIMTENGSSDWYCTKCKADCGLCSRAILNGHKTVQCDGCELWIHNEMFVNIIG